MGKIAAHWEDRGDYIRIYVDVGLRKNGLPNFAAAKAVEQYFASFNPDAFDPIEPVPEIVARAALRDGIVIEQAVMTANDPPLPVYEDDEMPGPRCQSGVCLGD